MITKKLFMSEFSGALHAPLAIDADDRVAHILTAIIFTCVMLLLRVNWVQISNWLPHAPAASRYACAAYDIQRMAAL